MCAHSLRRLGREGLLLKVAMQTANLRVNGHFLWPGSGVGLVGWAKLSPAPFLSVFLALRVNEKKVWCEVLGPCQEPHLSLV